MRDESSVELPYFIVDPENQKLVSGEISFAERSRQKLRRAIFWLALLPLVGVGFWLFFSIDGRIGLSGYCVIAVFVMLPLQNAITNLYKARFHRQVENGIFLDGQIVSSELRREQRGKGSDISLRVRYCFYAPDGYSLDGSGKAWRHDLWEQAKTEYPRMSSIRNFSDEDIKRLQAFAPPANTPVKIRYVNDFLYRVM